MHALIWRYYEGNLGKALLHVFPNIGLDTSLFEGTMYKMIMISVEVTFILGCGNWKDKRRKVFLDFARKSGFDPYVPSNWYPVLMKDIYKHEV